MPRLSFAISAIDVIFTRHLHTLLIFTIRLILHHTSPRHPCRAGTHKAAVRQKAAAGKGQGRRQLLAAGAAAVSSACPA